MFDYDDQPMFPAHLCDMCKHVTFNDANEDGDYLCKNCLRGLSERADSSEVAIRRAAMPRCKERHPELQSTITGFFTADEFVAACASCQAEVMNEQ